ncbi:uncharacterized protein LOC124289945 [Haliotis rubra]|uniref:uncharacterized protein LOC124289945 n=1 Tax=Haliotis rubra TaxID=36100 RepID=UPI001EE57A86|nr:uncharacterized protein LOC124289945 [Haliotis rubra]
MPAKHCAYGICRSDNRYGERPEMAGVHFILFPKFHKEPEKCARWVRACSRDGFTTDKVNKYTYLCSKHFVGGNGPSFEHPDPIPATYTSDQVVHFSKKRKNPVERHPLPSKVSRLDPTSTAGDDGLSLLAVCAADHPYTSRKHPEDQETICTELNVCDIEETALTEHSSSDAACQATCHQLKTCPARPIAWTKDDSASLHTYFGDFLVVGERGTGDNKGKLPRKMETTRFLDLSTPSCLLHLDKQAAYKKVRSKLFNDRKTIRQNVTKHLQQLL